MTLFMIMIVCLALCLIASRWHRLVAANEGETSTPDFRALVLELLGLPAETDDAGVTAAVEKFRDTAKAEEPTPEEMEAENARNREACKALGVAENASTEARHAALIALPGRVSAAENSLTAANEAAAVAIVDLAINEGRVRIGDRDSWLEKLRDNREKAANEIRSLQPMLPNQQLGNMGKRKAAASNARERSAQVQVAVNERMAKGMSYDEAYADAEKDPALASIFAAMSKPTHQEG